MNMLKAVLLGLQRKPVYQRTAAPTDRQFRRAKSRRQMAKASRRANR